MFTHYYRLRTRYTYIGLFCSLSIISHDVCAENEDKNDSQTTSLDTMVVTADFLHSMQTEGSHSYAAPGASIFKDDKALKDIPQSVSVMTRQRMDDQNLTTVQEVLEQTPGLYSSSSSYLGASDNTASFYSRGFEISDYMIDGVETNSTNAYGKFSFSGPTGSSAIYDRIEVLRGAAGLLKGNGKPGGAVNMVRKRPGKEFRQHYSLGAGSWDSYRGQIDLSGPLVSSGNIRGRFVTAYDDRRRFYHDTHSKSPLFYGIIEADLTDDLMVSIGASYEKYKEDAPKQDSFSGLDFKPDRHKHYSPSWGYKDTKNYQFFSDLTYRLNDDWKMLLATSYSKQKGESVLPRIQGHQGLLHAFSTDTDSNSLDATLKGKFDAFGHQHHLTIGANRFSQRRDVVNDNTNFNKKYGFGLNIDDLDKFDASKEWPHDDRMKWIASDILHGPHTHEKTVNQGVFGKLDFQLTDKLTLVMGGRASWYDYKYYDTTRTYKPDQSGSVAHKFTPYGGLIYALSPEWSLYGSYAEIFNPQWGYYTRNGSLIGNETGKNREVGIKGELLEGRLNTALSVYSVDLNHSAQLDNPPFDEACPGNPSGGGCYIDSGKKQVRGIDVEVNGDVLPGWQVGGGYTYTHTKIRSESSNNTGFTYTPRHMAKIFTRYAINDKLALGGGVFIQSKELASNNTTAIQHGYALWNLFGRYRVTQNVSAQVNIKNLFDKTYFPNRVADSKYMYGEPRSIAFTLNADF